MKKGIKQLDNCCLIPFLLLFLLFQPAGNEKEQKQAAHRGKQMIKEPCRSHFVKVGQHGRFADIREEGKVADALRARFACIETGPRLIAAVHHIASVFLAIYRKVITFGNGAGAVFSPIGIIQAAVIAVYRPHYGLAPKPQSQSAKTDVCRK